jgi:amidase
MEELLFKPAHEMAAMIRRKKISAVALLEAHFSQIARHNSALNAIVILDEEGACRRAWQADEALASGHCWGPLHGVPFTLKDHQDTAGLRSTMGGYPPFLGRMPEKDSTVAGRLKAAGAILMGKSNAVFFPFGAFGPSNNPWDLSRCPGVSSSGAAVALAAGLTPFDVGTDTNGSVLLPAHNCGVCGLRPTEGRVPLTGLTAPWPAQQRPAHPIRILTVFGPMARSVPDLKLVLRIIAGPDGRDSDVPPVPWREAAAPALSELRIAWTPSFPGAQVSAEIGQAMQELAVRLGRLGARIKCRRPAVDFARQVQISRLLMVQAMLNTVGQPVEPGMAAADRPSLGDYLQLLEERGRFIAAWERFFRDWDVLLGPACGLAAQPRDGDVLPFEGDGADQEAVTLPLRLAAGTGNPAAVIPLARDADGLPIGAQLIGPRWQDEKLLAIAAQISSVTDGFQRPPGF